MADEKILAALKKEVGREPVSRQLGLILETVAPGQARVRLSTGPQVTNILGLVHGTAIFALIDETFQAASNAYGTVAVALNMNLTFHQAPEVGEELQAEAQEVHAGTLPRPI
ncbi:MAG: PaaI family thioesterase [Desulfobacteraceae bacterium]